MDLGSEYAADFAIQHSSDFGNNWTLVEIERSTHKLFNQDGDPSSKLVHAIRQVQDWRQWVDECQTYADRKMPGVFSPSCKVIIGRTQYLTEETRKRLYRMNLDYRGNVIVMTYDYVLKNAVQYLQNLEG
jgi:hypothetical protein